MAVSVKENRIKYTIEVNKGGFLQVASETGKLKFAFKDLEQAMKAVSADIERQTTAHGRTAQVIQTEIAAMERLTYIYANQPQQYEKVRLKIADLEKEYQKLTGAARSSSNAMMGNVSNAGLAGAVLTEFNRTVSDANYGFRAVANNLSQMSTLFITLQSKVTESALGMGKFGGTLKMLGTQLMGPLGIILGFQLVITAIERFTMRAEKADAALKDFNVGIEAQIINVTRLKEAYESGNTPVDERMRLLKALGGLEDDVVKAAEKGLLSEKDITNALEARLILLNKKKELDSEDKKIQEDVVTLLKDRKDAEDKLQNLAERRSVIEKIAQEDRDTGQNNFMKSVDNAVDFYENKVKEANESINALVTGDRNPLVMQLAEAQFALDEISDNASVLLKEEEKRNEKRIKNADEVIKSIGELEEAYAQSRLETEDEKLEYLKNKELERLKELGASNEQLLKIEEIYNKLIKQARDKRISEEEQEELKKANRLAKIRGDALDKMNDGNKDYLKQRILEMQLLLNLSYLDAEKRTEIELKLHQYKMRLLKIEGQEAKDAEDQREKDLKASLDLLAARQDGLRDVFSSTRDLLSELQSIGSSRYDREINQLNNERDLIRSNNALTKEEKEQQLTELQRRENKYREAQIKQEQKFFMIKQAMAVSEMIMNGQFAVQRLSLLGIESVTSATTSVGKFMAALGPFGIPAFALAIGGVIASIISSVSSAKAEIAGLTNAPVSLGGGSSSIPAIQAPDFNVVGASAQNQLAQAIAGKEQQPIKAYVVSDDVTSAQELDRKIVEGASI